MKQNPLEQIKTITSLKEVAPIEKTRGLSMAKREQIKEIVEQPLVKACEIFWDKNIKTYESSANNSNLETGSAYIRIDYNSLSDENKEISKQYGEPYDDIGIEVVELTIPISETSTVQQITDRAVEIANTFGKQKLTWTTGIGLQEYLDWFGKTYGRFEGTYEEMERLQQPGVWEEESKRKGNYFDPETQTSWPSEELFNKYKEDLMDNAQ